MNYPTYKGPSRFTFKEVKRLFYIKYPKGLMTLKQSNYTNSNIRYNIIVSYTNNGKMYNYSVSSYTGLVRRLSLSNEVIEADNALDAKMVEYNAYTKTKQYIIDCNKNEFGIIFK